MKQLGLIHLYIGRGKGKTTAALGLASRSRGAKKRVCFIQFLKGKASSEIAALKRLKVKVILFKEKHPCFYKSASISALKKKVSEDLKKTEALIRDKRHDLIVLDEILYLSEKRLIKEDDVLRLIKLKPPKTELVLTGALAGKAIIKLADYVSTIKATKHPYRKGILARRGIEY